MTEVHRIVLFVVALVSQGGCYCPQDKIHSIGFCAYRIHCRGNIRNVSLPPDCQGASNYAVNVDITLSDPIERFDEMLPDTEILRSVTTFRVSAANWQDTKLSFLNYMHRIRNLYLINNQINKINGCPFYYLRRLETIDLSHNNLEEIEDLFQFSNSPNKLKRLSLAYNALKEIPGDAFVDLTSLVELDVSHNFISDLNEEPFSNLTSLEILKLNNNRIKDLNGAVNNLQNLKHLYLRGNNIQNVDEPSLKIIYHLETFDVSGNQLEQLKPIVFSRHWQHFGGVCKIILSDNQITSVPNGTSKEMSERFTRNAEGNKIEVLTKLDLSNNSISNIEYNAFQSIVQMMSLDLSRNKLLDFIVNPDDLVYVKYLNLSTNFLTHLYFDSFKLMSNLQNLDLSYNDLDYIPDETFTNNYNLKYVNMTYNEIEHLERLHIKMFHPEGGVLDLSNNGLTRLYIPIGEGLRLTFLILHSNNITDAALVNLVHQNDLKILEMNDNYIQKLNKSSLLLPFSLTALDLSDNNIQDIGPSSFYRVHHLQSLYLRRNELRSLEYGAFQGLSALSNLDLSYNKIGYLDSKVLMDLKSLSILSLRYNELSTLDYSVWFGHKHDLKVYVDGNRLNCNWLSVALKDFNNGFSKMRPTVHLVSILDMKNSVEGIPCIPKETENIENIDTSLVNSQNLNFKYVLADERLLITNQKILEAVKEQTYYLRAIMNRFNSISDEHDCAGKLLHKP